MVFRNLSSRYPVDQLRREMDRLFNGFLGSGGDVSLPMSGRGRPAVNVWETEGALNVELELPGIQSDQVDLSVIGDELSIKVDRPDVGEEGVTYHRRERGVGSFTRVLRLPVEIDAERVGAEMRHGVLTVTLPKAESARLRKIEVTAGA